MKFIYVIAILAQLAVAVLSRNESKAAYLLYLWSELSGTELHRRKHPLTSVRVTTYKATSSSVSDKEYSLFLEP